MTIRGILFDKDGTLVDFFKTWIPAYRTALDRVSLLAGDPAPGDRLLLQGGFDPATGELDPKSILASGTTAEICELWAAETGAADRAAVSQELHEAMERHACLYSVPVGDGLADLFGRLAGRGLVLGMATMDSESVARATADAIGLSQWLTFLCGHDSGHGSKPEPGMVRGFCAAAGLSAPEILVVGDTDRDMNMARAAGAGLAVAVLSGTTPHEGPAPLADRVIDSVLEIESVLD